jgi:hypothetical protein
MVIGAQKLGARRICAVDTESIDIVNITKLEVLFDSLWDYLTSSESNTRRAP